jgi:hypothetical protein
MEVMPMFGWKPRSWFYPKPTGDPGRDRNARTVQFACLLLAFAVSAVAILNVISGEPSAETPILVFCRGGLGRGHGNESRRELGMGGADRLFGRVVDRNAAGF